MKTHDVPGGDLATFLLDHGFIAVPLRCNAVGHLALAAEVNGHAAQLVLDTGASHTVLATSSAERFGLGTTPSAVPARGVGAAEYGAAATTVAELRLGAATLRDVVVRAFDLGHVNQALVARGASTVDGVLGGDVLKAAEAVIDYAREVLYLRHHAGGS